MAFASAILLAKEKASWSALVWKRVRWQYSQWKLLFLPLSLFLQWLLRGILEDRFFGYLNSLIEGKVGLVANFVVWAESHPALTSGVMLLIPVLVIVIWGIRDAKKRLGSLREIEDALLGMFKVALREGRLKAETITLDDRWDEVWRSFIKGSMGIDANEYKGQDMTNRREVSNIGRVIRRVTPTDNSTVPIYRQLASTMENNGYGVTDRLNRNTQYRQLSDKVELLRKVPSFKLNELISKCKDYIYILSNVYTYHLARMRITKGLSQATLADMRNFVKEQEDNTGDMSKCLTELRIEVDKFMKGKGDDGRES